MRILSVGITTIDGTIECLMSDNTPLGRHAAKSIAPFERAVLSSLEESTAFLYKHEKTNVIAYSMQDEQRIYTICTDKEIYPYTPVNLNYLHSIMQKIITAHHNLKPDMISQMITEGESHQPPRYPSQESDKALVRIKRLSQDKMEQRAIDIDHLISETSELTSHFTTFALKPAPIKKPSSFTANMRWFFSLFSFCGSCMSGESNNQRRYKR